MPVTNVYFICEKSGDIARGAVFRSVRTTDTEYYEELKKLDGSSIICCGDVNDEEKIFRTEDGRFYFTLQDGWGYENKCIYGMKHGLFQDFGQPTTFEEALAKCDFKPQYSTFGGALKYQARREKYEVLKKYIRRLSKEKPNKE